MLIFCSGVQPDQLLVVSVIYRQTAQVLEWFTNITHFLYVADNDSLLHTMLTSSVVRDFMFNNTVRTGIGRKIYRKIFHAKDVRDVDSKLDIKGNMNAIS